MFVLSKKSLSKLEGIHPDLIRVVKKAITLTEIDFMVAEGVRTMERQKELFQSGASKIMNSRHLTGHAVDLYAWVEGGVKWDWSFYEKIAKSMKESAKHLNISIVWGGDWISFKDGVHFELDKKVYP